MTKRLLALFLVCILAIPILIIPASAYEIDGITYDSYGSYLEQCIIDSLNDIRVSFSDKLDDISISLENIHDGITLTLEATLEHISGLVNGLWGDVVRIYDWITDTLYNALDTINDNIGALGTNISLYFKAQTETLSDWLENILDSVNGTWNAFLVWWEDWGERIDSIREKLDTLINGSDDNAQKSEDFENQVSTESTEFQENLDDIQEWTNPDYESDFDPSVEGITGGTDIGLYTDGLGTLFEIQPIFPLFLFMAFSFSAISFVVFGKR